SSGLARIAEISVGTPIGVVESQREASYVTQLPPLVFTCRRSLPKRGCKVCIRSFGYRQSGIAGAPRDLAHSCTAMANMPVCSFVIIVPLQLHPLRPP